jgi:hypothetical protein
MGNNKNPINIWRPYNGLELQALVFTIFGLNYVCFKEFILFYVQFQV